VGPEKLLDFFSKRGLTGADLIQKSRAFIRIVFQDTLKEMIDLSPSFKIHVARAPG
jgi:hypothetical protein